MSDFAYISPRLASSPARRPWKMAAKAATLAPSGKALILAN